MAGQPGHHTRDDAVAAGPVEREGVGHGVVDVARQALAKQAAGAEEARAHGGFRQAQRRRDLLDAQFLDGPQHEDRAKRLRQRVDARLHHGAQLRAHRGALRPIVRVVFHHVLHRDVREVDRGVEGQHLGAAAAQPTERLVDDDAHQPGRQARLGPEAAERAPGAQIGFLQRVFGFGVALEDAARRAEQQAVVPPHDAFEGGIVAAGSSCRQVGVGHAVAQGRGRCQGCAVHAVLHEKGFTPR